MPEIPLSLVPAKRRPGQLQPTCCPVNRVRLATWPPEAQDLQPQGTGEMQDEC